MEEEVFNDFDKFFGQRGERPGGPKGQDIFLNMEINFHEAITGCKKEIKVEKKGVCTTCNGNRCKPGTAPSKCFSCGGRGFVNHRQGPMTIQLTCTKCKGTGSMIRFYCPTCNGSGKETGQHEISIKVPPGIDHGHSLRMVGKVFSKIFMFNSREMQVNKMVQVEISLSKFLSNLIHTSEEIRWTSIQIIT